MSKNDQYPAFTNFTIKVDVKRSWPRTVTKVLNSVQGVTNFRMEDNGKINISGYIEPTQLLKCLRKEGKTAQIVHWQYGECSSNLFEKPDSPSNKYGNGSHGNYLYPGYGGYNGYCYNNCCRRYGMNYAYNHLECAGNASDYHGHHIEKPRTPDKSSPSFLQKPTDSDTVPTSGATCCSLM